MRRSVLLGGLLAALIATPAVAQTIGTPVFHSPYRAFQRSELGGYLSDPGEGVSLAVQGEYRMARPTFDWGVTLGYIDPEGDVKGVIGAGIDGRIKLARHTQDFPLDLSGIAGFGVLFRDGDVGFGIPLGVSLGRQVQLENSKVTFTPYVAPTLIPVFGDDNVVGNDAQFGLGLGVDIGLSPRLDVRVSGSLGDIEGVGVGLAWHR